MLEPSTTWALVSTWPSLSIRIPEPVAVPPPEGSPKGRRARTRASPGLDEGHSLGVLLVDLPDRPVDARRPARSAVSGAEATAVDEAEELSTETSPVAIATTPSATATTPPSRAEPNELREEDSDASHDADYRRHPQAAPNPR